jgi:hypothetical protein
VNDSGAARTDAACPVYPARAHNGTCLKIAKGDEASCQHQRDDQLFHEGSLSALRDRRLSVSVNTCQCRCSHLTDVFGASYAKSNAGEIFFALELGLLVIPAEDISSSPLAQVPRCIDNAGIVADQVVCIRPGIGPDLRHPDCRSCIAQLKRLARARLRRLAGVTPL